MSAIFHNFDSNGAGGEDSQDIVMASPSQSSPMANTNSNTGVIGSTTSGSMQNAGTAGNSSNVKSSSVAENQPVNIFKGIKLCMESTRTAALKPKLTYLLFLRS